ncbi:MAG: hypothetical protein IJ862_06470 [Selenomonadaceae bacterium]|nr:hypothetical protein [Selenomonadaceae bacterium]
MNKKFTALLMGAAIVSSSSNVLAAEDVDSIENDTNVFVNKSKVVDTVIDPQFKSESYEELSNYVVGGVVRDTAQKIFPFSIEARFFAPHFDAKVHSDKIHYNGGEVGLKDNLGFDNDNAPELILRYKRFSADYIHVHGKGNTNLNGDNLKFGGVNFSGRVHSQSDLDYLKLTVTNPIVSVLGSGVDWSYGLTGMYWKGKVKGHESTTGLSTSKSKEYGAPIPTIGVGAHAALLPSLSVYANIAGLPLGGYGHYYDFEAGLRYSPLEILGVTAGFRRIEVKLEHDDDSAKLTMNGPYAGLRVDL